MAKDDESIPLESEGEPLPMEDASPPAGTSKIQAFGRTISAARGEQKYSRPLNVTGAGATRCRMFHSKITIAALEHLVNQVNEWLDSDKIEIKCVNQVVGVMEGKTPEPNVIVLVWY
jgi:hypothetical protein